MNGPKSFKSTSATGAEGFLIWTAMNKFMFRVYDGAGGFVDYDIMHSDLHVRIIDEDASFYTTATERILDHDPETLGRVIEK